MMLPSNIKRIERPITVASAECTSVRVWLSVSPGLIPGAVIG